MCTLGPEVAQRFGASFDKFLRALRGVNGWAVAAVWPIYDYMMRNGVSEDAIKDFEHLYPQLELTVKPKEYEQQLIDVMQLCEKGDGFIQKNYGLTLYDLLDLDTITFRLLATHVNKTLEQRRALDEQVGKDMSRTRSPLPKRMAAQRGNQGTYRNTSPKSRR